MSNGAEVHYKTGDFADYELGAIAASLVQCDADQICAVAMVVAIHPIPGEHEFRIATTIEGSPRGVADLLRHAAAHTFGGCESCRTRKERRNRRGH